MSLMELRDVTKVYEMGEVQVHALRGIDLEFQEGEFVSVMGPSGSGKSTLMNIVGCLDQPSSGDYILDDENVNELSDDELASIRNRKVGFVFQTYNLLARTSAVANVELPLVYSGNGNRREKAIEALEAVGLGDRIHHKPNELSGGQQQRVAIARALINEPSIILADEPTGNLDSRTGLEIIAILQRLHRESGITVIYVTHDQETAYFTERIVRLRDGRVTEDERVDHPLDALEELAKL